MADFMDVDEFQEVGLIQEVNRLFFHPRGLALAVQVDEDGTKRFAGVLDAREDPEGFFFADWPEDAEEKAERVREMSKSRSTTRLNVQGEGGIRSYIAGAGGIQIVGSVPTPDQEKARGG